MAFSVLMRAVVASAWLFTSCLATTNVVINATSSHSIPTTLWGQMFEDISHSGDGGLYGELLQNRAFQQVTPLTEAALNAWSAVNGSAIAVVADTTPVSSALPNALQVAIPSGTTGYAGFANSGYWGIKVNSSWTYNASFYYRFPSSSSYSGSAVVALTGSSGTVYGSAQVTLSGSQTTWKQVSVTIKPTSSASSTDNTFTISIPNAGGQEIRFAMFSLFPPTFKNRANGMRLDIAETLAAAQPAFFRFPGGNNLEGQTTATRWQWNATVGALVDRPGRVGDWGYVNTDGLGLLEYLYWIEDAGMVPIMAVWAGYSLGGTSVAEGQLAPYIQQAIDQINFVVGDASESSAAALRSELGHPEPFSLKYVEVGNEDFFAETSYVYRWRDFVGNLSAAFPDIQFIATSYPTGPTLTPTPESWDLHVYQTPSYFASNVFLYDSYARDGTTYFQGEYASISTNSSDLYGSEADGRLAYPTIQSSVSEAAYMTGLERNSDIIFAASYAPLLMNTNFQSWTPNLVNFDAENVYPSTSYYVQKLFGTHRGDVYLPSTLPSSSGTLFWSVTRNETSSQLYIKIANVASSSSELEFTVPYGTVSSSGTAVVLSGSETTSNTPSTPEAAIPVTSTITTGKTFTYTSPAWSFSVLIVNAS